jgi:hypothetical protein
LPLLYIAPDVVIENLNDQVCKVKYLSVDFDGEIFFLSTKPQVLLVVSKKAEALIQ